jgi:hypothetical protein
MDLKIPAWSAVLSAIFGIPTIIIVIIHGYLLGAGAKIHPAFMLSSMGLQLLILITSSLIIVGFIEVAKKVNSNFLKTISYISLIAIILSTVLDMISQFNYKSTNPWIGIVLIIILGIINIIMGSAVLKLKDAYGGIATGLGVMYIVCGVFAVTVILMLLSPLTALVTSILEAVFFFKAAKINDVKTEKPKRKIIKKKRSNKNKKRS